MVRSFLRGVGIHPLLEIQNQISYPMEKISADSATTNNNKELGNHNKVFQEANKALSVEDFAKRSSIETVIDIRDSQDQLKQGYIKGAYLITEGMLASWAGAVISPNARLLVFAVSPASAQEAIRKLIQAGYTISGYNDFDIQEWKKTGGEVDTPQYSVVEDVNKNTSRIVLDVRNQAEWKETGVVKGAITIPLSQLENNIERIPRDKEIYVHCKAGLRARMAGSILSRHGINSHVLPLQLDSILKSNEVVPY